MSACSAISLPWSQVSERRSGAGSRAMRRDQRVAHRLGGVPSGGQVQQDGEPARCARPGCRSPTGCSAPVIRSPSQWPGTVRSAASAGRWSIIVMSTSEPARRASGRRCGLRRRRPVRSTLGRHRGAGRPGRAGRSPGRSSRAPGAAPAGRGTRARSAWLICSGLHRCPAGCCTNSAQHRIVHATCPRPGRARRSRRKPLRGERPVLPADRVAVAAQLPADRRRVAAHLAPRSRARRALPGAGRRSRPARPRTGTAARSPASGVLITGGIVQPPAAAAGDRAPESPALPGSPVDHRPTRHASALGTPRAISRANCSRFDVCGAGPGRPTNHRNSPNSSGVATIARIRPGEC